MTSARPAASLSVTKGHGTQNDFVLVDDRAGALDLTADEARAAVAAGTRRLARKQMGWFGRDPRVHWLDSRDPDVVARALALVAAADAGDLGPATDDPAPRRSLGS